jgi:predicted  nucleic acid-binding Zn-ribbon protein
MFGLLTEYLKRVRENLRIVFGLSKEIKAHTSTVRSAERQTGDQRRVVEQCETASQNAQISLDQALDDRDRLEENEQESAATVQVREQQVLELQGFATSAQALENDLAAKRQAHEQTLEAKRQASDRSKQRLDAAKTELSSLEKDMRPLQKRLETMGGQEPAQGLDAWARENEQRNLEQDFQGLEVRQAELKAAETAAKVEHESLEGDRKSLAATFSNEEDALQTQLDAARAKVKSTNEVIVSLDEKLSSLGFRLQRGRALRDDPSEIVKLNNTLETAITQMQIQAQVLNQMGATYEQTKQTVTEQKKDLKGRRNLPFWQLIGFLVTVLGIIALVAWVIFGVFQLIGLLS